MGGFFDHARYPPHRTNTGYVGDPGHARFAQDHEKQGLGISI
jgi:hypothetical protein